MTDAEKQFVQYYLEQKKVLIKRLDLKNILSITEKQNLVKETEVNTFKNHTERIEFSKEYKETFEQKSVE